MKILEPGREQKGWSIETRCTGHGNGGGGCNAKLLVEQPDLFLTYTHARDETDTLVTFRCEACGVLTDLTTKQEPPRSVSSQLPNRRDWELQKNPLSDG